MPQNPKIVEIISIGEELLIGKVVNTNASWLAKEITKRGGRVRRIITVGDKIDEIRDVIVSSISRGADVIITTGGLGPTFDDKTMEAISRALDKPLKLNEEAFTMLKESLRRRGLTLTESRRKMAYLPEGGRAIPNYVGTAPGLLIKQGKTTLVALPGVPQEMKEMFIRHVSNIVSSEMKIVENELLIEGIYEAELAPLIEELMKKKQGIYVKSHPKMQEEKPRIRLHIYSSQYTQQELNEICREIERIIKDKLKCKITWIE